MTHRTRTLGTLIALGALLAVPAAGHAHPPDAGPKGEGRGKGAAKRCADPRQVGFTVRGTLVALSADDAATAADEAAVTLQVTGANRHARMSGLLADQDPAAPGVQVEGASLTLTASSDPFAFALRGFDGAQVPSPGDKVKVKGRIARSPKRCAAPGADPAARYAAPDVRRVVVTSRSAG